MLCSTALSSVEVGGEHKSWWMQRAYLAAEDVASILAAIVVVGVVVGGMMLLSEGLVACLLERGTIHKPVRMHLWPQTMVWAW